MKRIITSILASALVAVTAGAQTMQDAISFADNNYYGTARSMSLGNAVTALGGDLGMIGINPAGSAVSPYSQFTISPGLSISTGNSMFFSPDNYGSERLHRCVKAKMGLPNIGLTMNFDTGRNYGIKGVSFGVVANTTSRHLNYAEASGTNHTSSMLGSYSYAATLENLPSNVFDMVNPWDNTDYSWNSLAAYGSNGIGYAGGEYLGFNENDYKRLPGELSQRSYREYNGTKTDLLMNLGFNFEDRFYFGFNLGIPVTNYSYNETFTETALEPSLFPVKIKDRKGTEINTQFDSAFYEYDYSADVDGIYGKFGFIFLPFNGLRIGAAIKTPTAYTITERWDTYMATDYINNKASASCGPDYLGEYRYNFRSPYEVNAGLAYTFGTLGLVSVDYEMMDYSIMKFRELRSGGMYNDGYFSETNSIMKLFAGVSHSMRVGLELNLGSNFAVRGGYSFLTSPERYYKDTKGEYVYSYDYGVNFKDFLSGKRLLDMNSRSYLGAVRRSWSAGLGYQSNGSFFADIAARWTRFPTDAFYCYSEYLDKMDGVVESPYVETARTLCDVTLTFGWRF